MTIRNLICATLIATMACGLATADEEKTKPKGKRTRKAPSATQRFVAKLELTEAQKKQVAEIDKKFGAKVQELTKKRQAILTDEQRATQRELMAKARKDGKQGQQMRKDMAAALKLTDAQKAQQKELAAVQQKLQKEIIAALGKVLTDEQKSKLPKRASASGRDTKRQGNAKKKKPADKS